MEQVLRIDTEGQIYLHRAQDFPLDRLQQLVGGYIEIVHPVGLVYPFAMIVDEEGLLKNKRENWIASYLYNCSSPIVGDVVIMVEGLNRDGERDIVGLTEEQARTCWRYLKIIQHRLGIKEKCPDTAATESEHRATTGA